MTKTLCTFFLIVLVNICTGQQLNKMNFDFYLNDTKIISQEVIDQIKVFIIDDSNIQFLSDSIVTIIGVKFIIGVDFLNYSCVINDIPVEIINNDSKSLYEKKLEVNFYDLAKFKKASKDDIVNLNIEFFKRLDRKNALVSPLKRHKFCFNKNKTLKKWSKIVALYYLHPNGEYGMKGYGEYLP
jgi:hypothetical protein